ncbi:MAG: helix-turn-helix domain-containing protein [Rhodobacteraceae bacterium]|nr:helix-turn-helix domain-containing protein [Paracoccaceae bacterium]
MTDPSASADFYADDKATLGDRITNAREGVGLSQEDLADKLGIELSTLRDWEEDLSEPRANRLAMLSGVFNVSLRWLMTGQGEDLAPTDKGITPEEISAMRVKLLDALDLLAHIESRMDND